MMEDALRKRMRTMPGAICGRPIAHLTHPVSSHHPLHMLAQQFKASFPSNSDEAS